MQLLRQLASTLIDCPKQTEIFLTQSHTLLRRALRLPHLREAAEVFPPHGIALCVVSHLGEFSLKTVHDAFREVLSHGSDHTPAQISMEDLSHVHQKGWKGVTAALGLQEHCEKDHARSTENGIFSGYYLLFATSLLFSERAADILLTRVKELGGNGKLVGRASIGLNGVMTSLQEEKRSSEGSFLITSDRALMRACQEGISLQVRPPKWVSDSVRDLRIKTAQLYIPEELKPAQQSEPQPCAPAKRKAPEYRAEVALSGVHSAAKKMRFTTQPHSSSESLCNGPNNPSYTSPTRIQCGPNTNQHNLLETGKSNEKSHQMRWACEVRIISFSGCDFPMNDKICELFGLLRESYEAKRDFFRAVGYQRGIAKIRSLDHEILTVDDAKKFSSNKGIGPRLERKIIEIITTGSLAQADAVLQNADNIAIRELCNVWGIGPVKALSLVAHGIKTVAQLREAIKTNTQLLDRNQTIGLRLYEDLLQRIPRKDVADLEMYVRRKAKAIDPALNITVAGSYLRGKKSCGDVDILVHGPNRILRTGFSNLKAAMRKEGVLTHDLIDGDDKYFGVFRFPGRPHGRVDLFYVPQEQYPFALLTYTGSAIFNRSMRAKARALGYSLSHKGIQRVSRSRHAKARVEPPICVKDEREIFALLDIPYVAPSLRSIS